MATTNTLPTVELIIKASAIDGTRKGTCLICQEFFMELFMIAEQNLLKLKVTTVNMDKPPADFKSTYDAASPPILLHNDLAVIENDLIERYIMKSLPGGALMFSAPTHLNKISEKLVQDLYQRFKRCIVPNQAKGEINFKSLDDNLAQINDHLVSNNFQYLTGDTMCCFDCQLMPRLQHIRVAGKHYLNYEINPELHGLWRYIDSMYNLESFKHSCPADQDIIHSYTGHDDKRSMSKLLEAPTYTSSIPANIQLD